MSYFDLICRAAARPARTLVPLALAAVAGCSDNNTMTMAMPDLATTPDMASVVYQYKSATIHQIDTDPGNGPFGEGQRVVLDRVVAVTKVDKYVSSSQQCRYQIWVQDPNCTAPPCGMVVKAIGPMAPSATSTGKDCPAARLSGTPLDTVSHTDLVRVRGLLTFSIDDQPQMTVVEHQLYADSIEIIAPNQTLTPMVISDPTVFAQFKRHQGTTWNKYEGMYLTLQPTTGTLQVSTYTSGSGFQTIPGSTDWGDTFDSDYYPSGASSFPTTFSTWKSISGVVSTRKGGELMPVRNKDFVP